MATADERRLRLEAVTDLLDRYGLDWVHVVVFDIFLVALAARLYDLGARVAHWDEGRVAYWILDYGRTGNFEYRPIIHGPFYHHVNDLVFGLLGATDFSMRFVVAVCTGLFPLVALLFRDRLRDIEVVALAGFLAINPVFLYYSRFMRGDPLVAVFMVAGFALFVRTVDTGLRRYFYAGVGLTALGFTVKENALLYLVTWAGAAVLLLDHRLFRAGDTGQEWTDIATGYIRRTAGLAWRHVDALLLGAVEFLVIIIYFYAPRAGSEPGPGLGKAFGNPGTFPAVVEAATIGAGQDLWGSWVAGSHQDHAYLPYLGDFLQTMGHGALVVSLLAIVGFVADRYSDDGPTDLVSFAFYWGFVSVLGYPIVTDIQAPWATIHAVVPLAIPAAVGVGLFVRWGRDAVGDDDVLGASLTGFVVLLLVGQVVAVGAGSVYANPQSGDNELVQYAQPGGDIQPIMGILDDAAPAHEGTDAVLYGEYFVDGPNATGERRPGCSKWFNSLPLPWYFERSDADVTCIGTSAQLGDTVRESQPPVVIAPTDEESIVSSQLPNYESRTHQLRAWDTETVFFVHEEYADELPPPEE